jgi:exodeoxyribonuclease-3
MKMISWNVNGIRAILGKGFMDFVSAYDPDILCLQEVKAFREQVSLSLNQYPYQYWNSAKKPGYSGTAIFSKVKPRESMLGIGKDEHDNEGRVLTLDLGDYYLVNVYTPNSKRELERLAYRQIWDQEFLKHVKNLESKKPVIFCGDLNVAHKEIDLANPKTNRRNAGFTDEERSGFDHIVEAGFVDTFRHFHQEGGQYTWWSYMSNARVRNIGWRIDYFCVSDSIKKELKSASIYMDVLGSDHCPVELVI